MTRRDVAARKVELIETELLRCPRLTQPDCAKVMALAAIALEAMGTRAPPSSQGQQRA